MQSICVKGSTEAMDDVEEFHRKIEKYIKDNKIVDEKDGAKIHEENGSYQFWKGMYEWELDRPIPFKESYQKQKDIKFTALTPSKLFDMLSDRRRRMYANELFEGSREIPLYEIKMDRGITKPLVGGIPQKIEHVANGGDMVTALVHKVECGVQVWILALIMEFDPDKDEYKLTDVDALAGDNTYTVKYNSVISLPQYRANPKIAMHALHKVGERVLALCPGTTLFLLGIIETQPMDEKDDYTIVLKHPIFIGGKSLPQRIPQRFVVSMSNRNMMLHDD